jgi:hypothetical protein
MKPTKRCPARQLGKTLPRQARRLTLAVRGAAAGWGARGALRGSYRRRRVGRTCVMTMVSRKTLKAMGLETLGISKRAYLNRILVNRTIRECRQATRKAKRAAKSRAAAGKSSTDA